MAKPPKHDAEFFPFYAKNGRTLKILQHRFGLAGIGFFTNLMRLLCTTPHHHLDLSVEVDRIVVYTDIGCEPEDAEAMIGTMIMTGKLSRRLWEEGRVLYCHDLVESLWNLYDKRTTKPPTEAELEAQYNISAAATPITGSETHQSGSDTGVSVPVMPQRKGEKRKGEKRREEKKETCQKVFDKDGFEIRDTKDPEPAAPATLSPMKDPVADRYQEIFLSWTPAEAWGSIPKERTGLKKLGAATRKLASVIGCTDLELTDRILTEYRKMKKSSKAEYWSNAPLTPSALLVRWDSVVAALDEAERKHRKKYEPDLVLREHRRSKGMTEEEIAKAEQDYLDFVKSCDEAWAAKGA